ncbi:MAG: hypothetical protein EA350_10995 [Gemmatimonadales bacterium]|nr:MAG: hypothetical protein EA350_10995 [Gemmatimonadales bacterium]
MMTGTDHAGRRRICRRALVGGLAGAMVGPVLAGALLLAAAPAALPSGAGALAAQSWSTAQFERQPRSERTLRVDVGFGAGDFRLAAADGNHLYRARFRYDEEAFALIHEYANGSLRLGLEGQDRSSRRTSFRRSGEMGELELRLGRTIPTELELTFGAVRAELDLGGIPLRSLSLTTGASEGTLRVSERNPEAMSSASFQVGAASFSARELGRLRAREIQVEAGVGEVRLDFEGLEAAETRLKATLGLGSLEIHVPAGVGIHLTRSSFLSSLSAPDLERRGNTWVSADWDTAPRRLRIDLETALGSVTVTRAR